VSAELLAEVSRLRSVDFGRFAVTEIELVCTDRFLSDAGTRVLDRFRLGVHAPEARDGPAPSV
jgi:hypothetical protein